MMLPATADDQAVVDFILYHHFNQNLFIQLYYCHYMCSLYVNAKHSTVWVCNSIAVHNSVEFEAWTVRLGKHFNSFKRGFLKGKDKQSKLPRMEEVKLNISLYNY